ncbi:uncharacterized protein LOC135497107 [Lineus longissimus]|uniref:uncharacterized protein LOC135497107 n=1 Tax=Lineus longissimus TaxID=88925 RepID=UPI002B4F194F
MAAAKPHLAKDNTMKVTAKEGVDFLKAEGAKDLLKAQGLIPDVKRVGTMENTAKEAHSLLAGMGGKVDDDAQTRGQQKQLDAITSEPPAKKAKLSKNLTMAATAQEAKGLLGGEKLGDTRQVTKSTKKKNAGAVPQKQTSIQRCIAESQYFVDPVDTSAGRQTRAQKRGDVYKTPEKKASKPAKAGGAKRGRKPKKAAAEPAADAE